MITEKEVRKDYEKNTKGEPTPLKMALKRRRQRLAQSRLGIDGSEDYSDKEEVKLTV